MRVRAIDSNRDYVCTGVAASEFLVNSAAAVAQCIQTTLQLWVNTWFLDLSAGLDISEILGKYQSPLYDSVIKDAILGVQGVNSITAYSSSVSNRHLTVNVSVASIFGPVTTTATTAL